MPRHGRSASDGPPADELDKVAGRGTSGAVALLLPGLQVLRGVFLVLAGAARGHGRQRARAGRVAYAHLDAAPCD